MTDIFHETKRERKYYEGKKQKALRYLDHTIKEFHDILPNLMSQYEADQDVLIDRFDKKLKQLKKLVNDI
jgi:hypothetical protein